MAVLRRRSRIITIGNEKGGVGKSTCVRVIPFYLALNNYRCLVIDMDPQGNTTDSLFVTRMKRKKDEVTVFDKTLMKGIQEGDISNMAIEVMENLDFIPSSKDLKSFIPFLANEFGIALPGTESYVPNKQKQLNYFKGLVDAIKDDYDFIFFDTPPTASDFIDTTAFASDYIVMACQTQTDSLKGARNFLNDTLVPLVETFGADFEVAGVLLNQVDKRGAVDNDTIAAAIELFGEENIFMNIITFSKAVQHIPKKGITDRGKRNAALIYGIIGPVVEEFLERLVLIEEDE